MTDDIENLRSDCMTQVQAFQIECNQLLQDLQNALDRLEFRFTHHIRDCQTMADEVDRNKESVVCTKVQMNTIEVELKKNMEYCAGQIELFDHQIKKVTEASTALTKSTLMKFDVFEPRMISFANRLESEVQG